jgi:hypothetical protein
VRIEDILILPEFHIEFTRPGPTAMVALLHLHLSLLPRIRSGNELLVESLGVPFPPNTVIPTTDYIDSFFNTSPEHYSLHEYSSPLCHRLIGEIRQPFRVLGISAPVIRFFSKADGSTLMHATIHRASVEFSWLRAATPPMHHSVRRQPAEPGVTGTGLVWGLYPAPSQATGTLVGRALTLAGAPAQAALRWTAQHYGLGIRIYVIESRKYPKVDSFTLVSATGPAFQWPFVGQSDKSESLSFIVLSPPCSMRNAKSNIPTS